MKLKLTDDISIRELNREFNLFFPCLRLDFYFTQQDIIESAKETVKQKGQAKLSEISDRFSGGVLFFKPVTTIKEFVHKMNKVHGLQVRLLRRSGDIWIEANESEEMTLQFENALGAASIRKIDFNVNMLFL